MYKVIKIFINYIMDTKIQSDILKRFLIWTEASYNKTKKKYETTRFCPLSQPHHHTHQ